MTHSNTSFLALAAAAFIASGAPVGAAEQMVNRYSGGFNAQLDEITQAEDSKANPQLVASAKPLYELAMKLRAQKNMPAYAQQLNGGMKVIRKAKN